MPFQTVARQGRFPRDYHGWPDSINGGPRGRISAQQAKAKNGLSRAQQCPSRTARENRRRKTTGCQSGTHVGSAGFICGGAPVGQESPESPEKPAKPVRANPASPNYIVPEFTLEKRLPRSPPRSPALLLPMTIPGYLLLACVYGVLPGRSELSRRRSGGPFSVLDACQVELLYGEARIASHPCTCVSHTW